MIWIWWPGALQRGPAGEPQATEALTRHAPEVEAIIAALDALC